MTVLAMMVGLLAGFAFGYAAAKFTRRWERTLPASAIPSKRAVRWMLYQDTHNHGWQVLCYVFDSGQLVTMVPPDVGVGDEWIVQCWSPPSWFRLVGEGICPR